MIRKDGIVIMTEEEYMKELEKQELNTLQEMASQIGRLSECDGIRQYFDSENKDMCVYDSYLIHNYFALCEEVAFHIGRKEYKEAEELVKDYIKNEEHATEESVYKAEYKELVRFLPKIVARRNQTTDIQLNRKDFLKLYRYAMKQMDIVELEDQDDKSEVLVYGNDFTVHYLGYFCSLGDGAAIYNHIIGGIEGLNEEEDDVYGEEGNND